MNFYFRKALSSETTSDVVPRPDFVFISAISVARLSLRFPFPYGHQMKYFVATTLCPSPLLSTSAAFGTVNSTPGCAVEVVDLSWTELGAVLGLSS